MIDKQILIVLFIIILMIVDKVSTKDYKLSSFKVNSAFHILNYFFAKLLTLIFNTKM